MNCSSKDHVCCDCDDVDDSEECEEPEDALRWAVAGGCWGTGYAGAGGKKAAPGWGKGKGRGRENAGGGTIGDAALAIGAKGGFRSLCASSCSSLWNGNE